MKNIFVVGSANTDMVVRVRHLPKPGETVIGGGFSVVQGGKGANQAVAARRAGGRVYFVGCVGSDDFGTNSRASLDREGIDVTYLATVEDSPSGVALIFVNEEGENCIAVAAGANGRVEPRHVATVAERIRERDVVLVQQESPAEAVREAVATGHRWGASVILNPAPARTVEANLLKEVTYLVPNETEAEALTGIHVRTTEDARRAALHLLAMGPPHVLITLGAQGVWVANASGGQLVKGFRVPVVDTTAAGDVFCGALAVALTEELDLMRAVAFANAAAALSVTKAGAQPSAPPRAEIDAMLADGRIE